MTFDCLFEEVDDAISEYAGDCGIALSETDDTNSFGFQINNQKEAVRIMTLILFGENQPLPIYGIA